MSAVILKLAEPLMKKHASNPERASVIIMVTIAAWNKSMFPEEKQPMIEKDLIDCFVPKDGSAQEMTRKSSRNTDMIDKSIAAPHQPNLILASWWTPGRDLIQRQFAFVFVR